MGDAGERAAQRFLKRRGLRVIARNWTCSAGEIDIIARDGDQLVVIEVRTSRAGFAGGGAATVGPDKQRRVTRLAQIWRQREDHGQFSGMRFDVVALRPVPASWVGRLLGRGWEIDWYPDAWTV